MALERRRAGRNASPRCSRVPSGSAAETIGNVRDRALAAGADLQRYRHRRYMVAGSVHGIRGGHSRPGVVPCAQGMEGAVPGAVAGEQPPGLPVVDCSARWPVAAGGRSAARPNRCCPGQFPHNAGVLEGWASACAPAHPSGAVGAPCFPCGRSESSTRMGRETSVPGWPVEHDGVPRDRNGRSDVASPALGLRSRGMATDRRDVRVDDEPASALSPRSNHGGGRRCGSRESRRAAGSTTVQGGEHPRSDARARRRSLARQSPPATVKACPAVRSLRLPATSRPARGPKRRCGPTRPSRLTWRNSSPAACGTPWRNTATASAKSPT